MEKYWRIIIALQEKILNARTLQEEELLEKKLDEVVDFIEHLVAEDGQ